MFKAGLVSKVFFPLAALLMTYSSAHAAFLSCSDNLGSGGACDGVESRNCDIIRRGCAEVDESERIRREERDQATFTIPLGGSGDPACQGARSESRIVKKKFVHGKELDRVCECGKCSWIQPVDINAAENSAPIWE